VSSRPVFKIVLAIPARRDFAAIIKRSRKLFGSDAAKRYETLVAQALRDIRDNPTRLGSQTFPLLTAENVRIYRISLSRGRTSRPRVKDPRHFLLYRISPGIIEVGRILDDVRDLPRHLPASYRARGEAM
jgi:toxin ParE1/3/4